jgi:oligoendopeptidase F
MMKKIALAGILVGLCFGLAAGAAQAASGDLPQRSDIADQYKWRLEDIYATNDAWEQDFQKLEQEIPGLTRWKGRLAEKNGAVLLEALTTQGQAAMRMEKLFVYAGMRTDEDLRVDSYASMLDRIQTLSNTLSENLAYMQPEILAIDRDRLWKMVDATKGLDLYRHYLDDIIRTQAHTLSADKEELLASAGNVTGSFMTLMRAFQNADLTYGTMLDEDGNKVELSQGRYYRFQESKDRRVREESWKLFYQAYQNFGRTLAANMSGNVKSDVFYAKARNYDSALEAAVDQNAIPVAVYKNLIGAVTDHIAPLHRYVAMRKRILGVDTLQVWDMAAPLVDGLDREYDYETAVAMVTAGLQPLGEAYLTPFTNAFNEGWVDVYETQGKRGGAYSWGAYATKPYLLLNYTGSLEDVFTLAHEMGHSMHSYFTRKNQPFVYGDYSIFVAEVASTTNEALMIDKMLADTDDRTVRMALLNHYLEQIRGTFFTQVLFADFELQMHEMVERGEPLTKESLDALYIELYQKYFGPAINVTDLNGATWSRIPHFYRNFYVYQYATSYAGAVAMAKMISEEGAPAVERYLTFLKSGSSDYPIDVLKKAGIDLTTPKPFVDTIETFDHLLDLMEAELDKGE